MKKYNEELSVGVFVFLSLLCVGYLTLKLGNVDLFLDKGYVLTAKFASIAGLRTGADIQVSGVSVGKVTKIDLAYTSNVYLANVTMRVREDLRIYDDASVTIKTSGIIGDQYLSLNTGGGSETLLSSGDEIYETTSTVDVLDLISKYAFGDIKK
ncbi:MAG: MlaD family protein [Deltaproteobacteria bacterium]|jgi:phospholipid/cholesterol/gamma-HCH transport system substrate-binding protein|nr:MlaD family protein [Deltaproteobacteria bacterium]